MKNAILDTNIFLHWDIKSVDWCTELSTDTVVIIICPSVLRELDEKKKDYNKTIAERARRNLSLIEELDSSGNELRSKVKIIALGKEPKVNWDEHGLDPTLMDDRILASIIERNDKDDVLVTSDSTPRIKARKRNITTIELKAPPLDEPKSETEKELERLKQELSSYKDKTPKLSLHISAQLNQNGLPKFSIQRPSGLSDGEIDTKVENRKKELDIPLTTNRYSFFPNLLDIQGYREDVNKHLQDYRKYLNEKKIYEEQMSDIIEMNFILSCDGRVPATEVYCKIEYPEGFKILKRDEAPTAPIEPDRPFPMSLFQRMNMRFKFPTYLDNINLLRENSSENRVRRKIESNVAEIRINKIQHGFERLINDVFVRLPSLEEVKNFQISYEIHADNLPSPVKGVIPVAIEK